MMKTIPKFETIAAKCSEMMLLLDDRQKIFFNDNLRVYAYYMTHISKTLYHYMYAYNHQANKEVLLRNLDLAYKEAVRAQDYLFEAQHGVFANWYTDAEDMSRTFQIDILQNNIITLKDKALDSD